MSHEKSSLELSSLSSPSSPPLPSPATAPSPPKRLTASTIIPIWILLSSSVIIYNNYLYNTLDFPFPVFLVTFHLTFAACGTRLLQRTTRLLDAARDVQMDWATYTRRILPIGVLFSGSLILSNTAYLYLSVSYIQMLKAFTPVAILLISWTFRLQDPSKKLAVIVFMISSGVALASHGELRFHLGGFLVQAGAVLFEASRLVLIQILLHNLKMDPLVSLHYYAPVCALINLCVLPFTEVFWGRTNALPHPSSSLTSSRSPLPPPLKPPLTNTNPPLLQPGLAPFRALADIGPLVLLSNAAIAFLLNVAAVFLVGVGSGLVLTLAGVFKTENQGSSLFSSLLPFHPSAPSPPSLSPSPPRSPHTHILTPPSHTQDILLITGSVLIFGSAITPLQVFGYAVALAGLVLFKTSGGK
ncbi:hypothetical protein DXG03_002448 [Asterophora parasitica]|uniref:Sugar phosphate transporter domain-containing protein n=1 Tax=Asterophora parasitica TaxID=117018 RepID=A0A9P7GGM4_9AGAR|nr:hypothetical protein DXG03_002448 [Asterophora parasitica]